MEKIIQLISDKSSLGSITVHPKVLGDSKIQQIQFGIKSLPIKVQTSSKLPLNQVCLSTNIIEMLNIPLNCPFEFKHHDNTIQIGPYIGLLAGYKQKSVKKRLEDIGDYLYHYPDINGAILAFSLDKVDSANHTVEGFLYNQVTKDWEEGTFSYPSSIFIITGTVSSKWIKHFQSIIGDCVFNNFYLNKWDIHKILAESKVHKFLPISILYKDPRDIYSFLEKYPSLIIKSINASKGSDIYKIEVKENNLEILYPKTGKINKFNMENREDAKTFFKDHFEEDEFMIQESLQLMTYKNRTIDFRVIVLKNNEGLWQEMGVFARHGKPGNILSNIYPTVKLGKETIEEVLGLSNSDALLLIRIISEIALESAKAMEKTGIHFGNTGVDIAIDKNKKIKIIEIQHCNPSHDIALEAGAPELYYEILKTNMLYAKKLAGF